MKNKIYRPLFLGIVFCLPFILQAQDKKKYDQAELYFNNNQYTQALPLLISLDSAQTDNNNLNFQIGVCYFNAPLHQEMAIPYLTKASKDISDKYTQASYKEKHAPSDAILFLAKAYHVTYKFDTAISYYKKFKNYIDTVNDKETAKDVDRSIQMCITGKELVAHPVKMDVMSLGDSVNSPYADFCPVVTADESQIFFTSRRPS